MSVPSLPSLPSLLSTGNVVLTLWGYPLSLIELVGTVLYLASVWLIARRNVLTWPVGIASVLLYLVLFYEIRLYADALEQLYYLGASAYGWWYWTRGAGTSGARVAVRWGQTKSIALWLGITAVGSAVLGMGVSRFHLWWPGVFPEPASFPFVDAGTTVASLVAMWLMARKQAESWLYWIVVDAVAIWLYFQKEVRFVALLYVVLLAIALRGFASWRRAASSGLVTRS